MTPRALWLLLPPLLCGPLPARAAAEPAQDHAHHAGHAHPAPPPEAAGENAALTVPPEIYREFQAIEALAAQSAYREAEARIGALLPRLRDDPGAEALLLRNLATLQALQKRYAQAAETLRRALARGALAAADADRARLEQGQYLIAAEDYPAAAAALSAWIARTPAPSPEHHLLLAEVEARLRRYPEAAAQVERAIAAAPAPKTEWYELLLGLYHEARDFGNCARTLEALIRRAPDHLLYWQQLAGIHQEAGQAARALAVRQLMHARGLLQSAGEILPLVQALRAAGLPTRAAELLRREIAAGRVARNPEHLGLLADAWTEAREFHQAAAALEESATLRDTADTRHRLGQLYSELHDWAKARQALAQAVARGGLANPGGAWLLLGLAEYKLQARERARAAFLKAMEAPPLRQTAKQWLEHLDRESQPRPKAAS